LPCVAAISRSTGVLIGALKLRQALVSRSPLESGAWFADCPQTECSAVLSAATAASTSRQGSNAVLKDMAIQANTNHRPQRFVEFAEINQKCRFAE